MTLSATHNSTRTIQTSVEIAHKLEQMRNALDETGAAGIRLRGTDWFSWATAGACHTVLLAAETGVAEVLVTHDGAWILTSEIEAQRFKDEELPDRADLVGGYELFVYPWINSKFREGFVEEVTHGGAILSDLPSNSTSDRPGESPLPPTLIARKRIMLDTERDRYRQVGRLASEAMTEVLFQAQPHWTEYQLAGAGANALWSRGLHPALTLAAGERRLPLYRHPTPTQEPIGRLAMLVFCARGYGLYANLTRFVYFGSLTGEEANLHQQVRVVEAAALNTCRNKTQLNQVYGAIAHAYKQQGHLQAIREHHQGGTTGYLSREIIVTPTTADTLAANMVMAWNPSLVGAKIEDTFGLLEDGRLENFTFDSNWPSAEIEGRLRPLPLER
jgi:Xaa-Pro aminopeptidase